MVKVFEGTPKRLTSNNSTGECRHALFDGWMRDRPRPKLVRLDPDGAYVSNATLEEITGRNLDVQVPPPEAPWHLSGLGIVQQLVKRAASRCAMNDGRTITCAECLNTALHSSQSLPQVWRIHTVSVVRTRAWATRRRTTGGNVWVSPATWRNDM